LVEDDLDPTSAVFCRGVYCGLEVGEPDRTVVLTLECGGGEAVPGGDVLGEDGAVRRDPSGGPRRAVSARGDRRLSGDCAERIGEADRVEPFHAESEAIVADLVPRGLERQAPQVPVAQGVTADIVSVLRQLP